MRVRALLLLRAAIVCALATLAPWVELRHVAAGDESPSAAESLRVRLVKAYRESPRFHQRLRVQSTRDGGRMPADVVELYREGAWFGIFADVESESAADGSRLGRLSRVSDGRRVRSFAHGMLVVDDSGPIALDEERAPLTAALREISALLPTPLAMWEPNREEFRVGVSRKRSESAQFFVTTLTGWGANPSWLERSLWRDAQVTEDTASGLVTLVDAAMSAVVRARDGGLDGFVAKDPASGEEIRARLDTPTWTPEQWQRRIRDLLARPAKYEGAPLPDREFVDSTLEVFLRDAFDAVLRADPALIRAPPRLSRVVDALVRGFLLLPAIVARRPVLFGDAWPIMHRAVEGDSAEEKRRRSLLVPAFEKQLRAAITAGAGRRAPAPVPK